MRMAFSVIELDENEAREFADAIIEAKTRIHSCPICGNLTDEDICYVCDDDARDRGVICVVEDVKAVMSIEKVREYCGLYHVLGGVISPRTGISPNDITIPQLIARIEAEGADEVIIATNATVEGETTALYIARLLKPYGVKTTRIAYGIPVGGDLEYADKLTLLRAIEGRREV